MVDISKAPAHVLLEWKKKSGKEKHERSAWVFASKTGTVLDGTTVRKIMTRILKQANLPLHFTPHCLGIHMPA
jgi:integrase